MNNHLLYTCTSANVPIKLKTFVELTMDVASASPRRYFFEARTLNILTLSVVFCPPRPPLFFSSSLSGNFLEKC